MADPVAVLARISNIDDNQRFEVRGNQLHFVPSSICQRIIDWVLRNFFCYKPPQRRLGNVFQAIRQFYDTNIADMRAKEEGIKFQKVDQVISLELSLG